MSKYDEKQFNQYEVVLAAAGYIRKHHSCEHALNLLHAHDQQEVYSELTAGVQKQYNKPLQ